MMVAPIDTYAAVNRLMGVNLTREQAEVIVDVFATTGDDLATKDDVTDLRKELRKEISSLRDETHILIEKTRDDLHNTMELMRRDLTVRIYAAQLASVLALITILSLFGKIG